MRIPVIYINGSLGIIGATDLDDFLDLGIIKAFKRATGWARVGFDEIRSKRNDDKGSWKDRKSNRAMICHHKVA